MSLVCLTCNGLGFYRREVDIPASVYGKPTKQWVTGVCSKCKGKKRIELSLSGKDLAAEEGKGEF